MEFILPGTDIRTGFMATPDGANVVGQPEVVANGILRDRDQREGWMTWEWEAREPMAS